MLQATFDSSKFICHSSGEQLGSMFLSAVHVNDIEIVIRQLKPKHSMDINADIYV